MNVATAKASTIRNRAPAPRGTLSAGADSAADGGVTKTAVKVLAYAGNSVYLGRWGWIVHDIAGMRLHKGRITLDFCHDERESIGYLDEFDTSKGVLWCRGFILSAVPSDLPAHIVRQAREGVPFEASIMSSDPEDEYLDKGESAVVNGKKVEGPAIIVRKWNLRAVAVLPHGADKATITEVMKLGMYHATPISARLERAAARKQRGELPAPHQAGKISEEALERYQAKTGLSRGQALLAMSMKLAKPRPPKAFRK